MQFMGLKYFAHNKLSIVFKLHLEGVYEMRVKQLTKSVKMWVAAIMTVLLLACFIPIQIASASTGDIVGVDGRIIPKDKTGDTSAWIEIAKFDSYSLILRQEPLTSKPIQFRTDLVYDNQYTFSTVRRDINNWYNYTLSSSAGLRNFAVTNNAMSHWGTYGTTYVDGISQPLGAAAPNGDDIAFALSFCEAAFFCSTQYISDWTTGTLVSSPKLASNNYLKLLPKYVNGGATPAYWLRTPGTSYTLACCVAFQGQPSGTPIEVVMGRTNQNNITGVFGHYRPAMWVGSGIFGDDKMTVTYNPNGAASSVITDTVTANTSYTIRADNTYTRTGYTFVNWNTMPNGTGVTYNAGQTVNLTASLTLYAQWKATPQLAVTYYPNGGTGRVITDSVNANTTYTIRAANTYTRTGYTFVNWNTRADGLGVTYNAGQTIYLTASITLYAQWKQDPKLTVTYNPNGSTGNVITESVDANTYYIIQSNPYTMTGYTFVNWNTRADGLGVPYTPGQSVYMTASLTLYAQFKLTTQAYVIYDPNGGMGNINIIPVNANISYTIRDQGYSRNQYIFSGWNTKVDGTGTNYSNNQSINITSTIILYAMWIHVDPVIYVVYDPNGGNGSTTVIPVLSNTYYTIQDQGFTKPSYRFTSWNTLPNGTGIKYNNGDRILVTNSVILYAQW
jgi:uncharacterized repeat protein (TIGR02543 family)